MNRAETIAAIRAAAATGIDLRAWSSTALDWRNVRSVLVCDPDAHTPGVAYYTPALRSQAARCWVWGGNNGSAALSTARGVASLLETLAPGLVVIEGQLASGGAFARSMGPHSIVRGGWVWCADLAEIPRVILDPETWQRLIVGNAPKGGRKAAYKAHACELMRKARVNEDAAAALCMLDFTLRALGLELPDEIFDVAP